MKIIKEYGLIIIIGLLIIGYIIFMLEFGKGFGGNISTITCVDSQIKTEDILKNIDSFFDDYPKYHVPDSIQERHKFKSLDYDHLALTKFYFSDEPIEIYYIQWTGPGCINIRFKYDPLSGQSIGMFRGDPDDKINKNEVNRIKHRFESEVISKFKKYNIVERRFEEE